MSVLDLNDLFPEGKSGKRGPLPKQRAFLASLLAPQGPKYVMYSGGVGSGKTLIGCVSVLTLAVQYPGDYLVCRLYNPELKITTYKTFLDICPPELILENRVADQIVRLRSNGGVANIIFRGLEEPDKHRSLNLNAAYIDEASQVSEAAFVLLQSRLRGAHVRKIFMTTNPNGHSWLYRLFVKKDLPTEAAKRQFFCITAPSTENVHLPADYVQSMYDTFSPDRIKREIEASWDAFQGQVYSEFSRHLHVIKPFIIPKEWTRFVGADHGYRNPSAWLWVAMDYDGDMYVYREYYETEHTIKDIVNGSEHFGTPGVVALNGKDKIDGIWIDPSTKANRGKESDWDTYLEYLPKAWALIPANNEVEAGIDRVKSLLKPDKKTGKPRLFVFDSCTHLIDEIGQYRYQELLPSQEQQHNIKEAPVKKDDHTCFHPLTLIATPEGNISIKDIRPGMYVHTSLGPKLVAHAGVTGYRGVFSFRFKNGTILISTPDHPVLLTNGKKKAIGHLDANDKIAVFHGSPHKAKHILSQLTLPIARLAYILSHTGKKHVRPLIALHPSGGLHKPDMRDRLGLNRLGNALSSVLRIANCKYTAISSHEPYFVGQMDVYNMSVMGVSEFYADGILVSNCDALRYAVMSRPEAPKREEAEKWRREAISMEGSLARDLHRIRHKDAQRDPFSDF